MEKTENSKYLAYEEQIVRTFITLLREKPYQKITITELCKKAKVGRGTFYLHYQSIDDIFNATKNDLITEVKHKFLSPTPKDKEICSYEVISELIEYIDTHHELFTLLMRYDLHNVVDEILKIFIERMKIEASSHAKEVSKEYIEIDCIFAGHAILGCVEYWIKNNYSIDRNIIVNNISNLIMKTNTCYE